MDSKAGTTYLDHLEAAAKQGSEKAIERLSREYPYDPGYEYLIEWTYELVGRSGVGFGAIAPLSYPVIESWARLRDIRLQPYEVRALIELEDALRNPGKDEKEEETDEDPIRDTKVIEFRPRGSWPKRRREPELDRGE